MKNIFGLPFLNSSYKEVKGRWKNFQLGFSLEREAYSQCLSYWPISGNIACTISYQSHNGMVFHAILKLSYCTELRIDTVIG